MPCRLVRSTCLPITVILCMASFILIECVIHTWLTKKHSKFLARREVLPRIVHETCDLMK